MDSFSFLGEECASVGIALKEALRFDYGPEESEKFFVELEDRLRFIAGEIKKDPGMSAALIATHMGSLAAIGGRISLIERSHLGEFSWPFSDAIRNIAERLFVEDELFAEDAADRSSPPLVHVIAEGMGYRVFDDVVASRLRRILIVAFPRQLKHHVLIHPILAHELGHPAARSDRTGKIIAGSVLRAMKVGPLGGPAAAKRWLRGDATPLAIKAEVAKCSNLGWVDAELLRNWRTEIFCDLFGLYLFGPAFAAAHRAFLEPQAAWPEKIDLQSYSHPPYPVRRAIIASAMRLREWDVPVTVETDGDAHDAEMKLLTYAGGGGSDTWSSVLDDIQLKAVLDELDQVFAPHSDIAYTRPAGDLVLELIERLTRAQPPIAQCLDESGTPSHMRVTIQHCLYAGWCFWFGREALHQAMLADIPRLRKLDFLKINQLCEYALLQQRAINMVLDWQPQ